MLEFWLAGVVTLAEAVTVSLAGEVPLAMAVSWTEPASKPAWVAVTVPVQVTLAPGAKVMNPFPPGQVMALAEPSVEVLGVVMASLTPTSLRVVFPVLVTTKV
jgi:hypothetical protein